MRVVLIALAIVSLALPASAAEERPLNILFAISDDQSWMHVGAYGDKHTKTPAFDRIAKEGVLFNYAYCAAPSCAPSRAAILTGKPIWQLEEGGLLFGILQPKFAQFTHGLEAAGYQTASTGKTWGPGKLGAGAKPLFQKDLNRIQLPEDDRRRGLRSTDYAANFKHFLAERDKSKPFFFWYGSSEPHQNYDIGGWKEAGKTLDQALLPGCIPDNEKTRGEFLDYSVEIEHFDRHLHRMLAALEKAGELDNTLIVVTSDHGNPMPRSKCNLYDSGVRVPLAIRLPGRIPAGRNIDDFVGLWDLAPTFLEMAGAKIPSEVTGKSLLPILSSQDSGRIDEDRDFIVTAFERHIICRADGLGYPVRSIRTHRWAYLKNYETDRWPAGGPNYYSSHQGIFGDCDSGVTKTFLLENRDAPKIVPFFQRAFGKRPAEELYDMQRDPEQLNNLAGDPQFEKTMRELEARMESHLKSQQDPRMSGKSPWDAYPFTDGRIFKSPNWKKEGFGPRKR
jgi:N-sulfoglucosamine sulfohydrolase